MDFLIGIGEDSHHIEEGRDGLYLGGVKIENFYSPDSNTDGDVIIHALFNAVFSALGDRSVGFYFKDFKGRSIPILERIKEKLNEKGYKINNISISIIGKKPKIEPLSFKIKEFLSEFLGIEKERIGITATSDEELSKYGEGKAIKASVIVSLLKQSNTL